ncbi:Phosphonopyruvate decarboxylase, putative, partial [Perkinsus marinus ATCC 50983]
MLTPSTRVLGPVTLKSFQNLGKAAFSTHGTRSVNVAEFYNKARACGVGYFTGVPDSLLKDFCAYVTDHAEANEHVIAVNEGSAVGLAAGYHLATGKLPIVYTQNSGYGNMVNPLLSLAHPGPIFVKVLVGWRGEPGVKDEPQHKVMGKLQAGIIQAMDLACTELPTENTEALEALEAAAAQSMESKSPHLILIRKDTFSRYGLKTAVDYDHTLPMTRENAIRVVLKSGGDQATYVGTTGFLSRELFEIRTNEYGGDHSHDFLCVGNMGHAGSIAGGLASHMPSESPVVCMDGDGALLMHMGSMATNKATNLIHVLVNNGMHESVGGQPTAAAGLNLCGIARDVGYPTAIRVRTEEELSSAVADAVAQPHGGPVFIEVLVKPGVRTDLGRPTTTPQGNK